MNTQEDPCGPQSITICFLLEDGLSTHGLGTFQTISSKGLGRISRDLVFLVLFIVVLFVCWLVWGGFV